MQRNIDNWTGEIVRHFKGDIYLVMGVGSYTENSETLVAYKALYATGKIHFRPYEMFAEEVPKNSDNPTGQTFRFELYEPKSYSEYNKGD